MMRNNLNQKRCGNKINTDDEEGRLLLSSLLYLHSISQKLIIFQYNLVIATNNQWGENSMLHPNKI
jgi:hypothetical protein